MGRLRLSFSARRRALLARRIDHLDRLERRSNAEPITVTALTIGAIPALAQLGIVDANGAGNTLIQPAIPGDIHPDPGTPGRSLPRPGEAITSGDLLPLTIVPEAGRIAQGGGVSHEREEAMSGPADRKSADDWLTLSPVADPATDGPSGPREPWQPVRPIGGGGAALPPRGGSGNGTQAGTDAAARGEITPLRLSPPASSPTPIPIVVGFGPTGAAAGTMAASALSVAPASSPGSRTPALSTPDAASVVPAPGLPPVIEVVRHRTAPAPGSPAIGGPSPLYNIGLPEIYVLDVNRGVQLLPNYQSPGTHLNQLATLGASVDLLAQVHLLNDTMDFPGYYSWDTSGLTHANSFSGTSTDELTFHWYSTNSTAAIDTVTLHVHTSAGSDFDYPYSFSVPTLWSAPQKLVHLKWESLARLCPGGAHEEATDCRPGGAIAP